MNKSTLSAKAWNDTLTMALKSNLWPVLALVVRQSSVLMSERRMPLHSVNGTELRVPLLHMVIVQSAYHNQTDFLSDIETLPPHSPTVNM